MLHFIHIGFPKTGSTWLQNCLFSRISEIGVLGSKLGEPRTAVEFVKEVRQLVLSSELAFDRARFHDRINELMSRHTEYLRKQGRVPSVLGISHEVLSGQFLTGRGAPFIAGTLHNCFPDAKIILFIRNQQSMMVSAYKQYIRQGGVVGFKEFLMAPEVHKVSDGLCHDNAPFSTGVVEYFKYSRVVQLYKKLFGEQNVYVDCLERLKNNKEEVGKNLFSFLGVKPVALNGDKPVNLQLTPTSLSILRQLNKIFKTHYNPRGLVSWTRGYAGLWSLIRDKSVENDKSELNPYVASFCAQNGIQRRIAALFSAHIDKVFLRLLPKTVSRDYFRQLPADYREWLLDEYRKDNTTLQELVNFDLGSLNYPL